MTDTPASPAASLEIAASGDFTFESHDIDPADQAIADEIANSFDPANTPGPVEVIGALPKITRISASALPPEHRDPILAAMANAPQERREAIEDRMVAEALNKVRIGLRMEAGLGKDANAYERERFNIARDFERLDKEEMAIQTELAAVDHWRPEFDDRGYPVIDPATGQQRVKAYDKLQGEARRGRETRLREIINAKKALETVEGPRRAAKALREAVAERKRLLARTEIQAAAEKRAEEILREEEVEELARAFAKRKRPSR